MIREAAAYNADTERKVVNLSAEIQNMLREIKIRVSRPRRYANSLIMLQDQSLQESNVKVETLERRLEATRKQADLILAMEKDVSDSKKQAKVYEDAIEQLQAEQDALESDNTKLRKAQGVGERQGNTSSQSMLGIGDSTAMSSGGTDVYHLGEQVSEVSLNFVGQVM